MTSAKRLSAPQRLFLSVIGRMSELSEGYTPGFLEELVRQHGVRGLFKWGKATQAIWNELVARYGEMDAHAIASFGSLWNGCDYCAYGHALAFNLEEFEKTGKLFPLDEAEIPELLRMRDGEILDATREKFVAAGREDLWRLLERQHQLKNGAPKENEEDIYLSRASALYEWINECSIMVEAPAPPLGRIAKKKALRQQYDAARAEARKKAPVASTQARVTA